MAPAPKKRSKLASALDEPFAFIESSDEEASASGGDLCFCGSFRREHDGEGKIEGRCGGFKEKS